MTDLSQQLREAGEKATPGAWAVQPTETEGDDLGCCIVGENLGGLIGATLPWPTEIDSGDYSRVEANAALIVLLLNNLDTIIAALEAQEAGK